MTVSGTVRPEEYHVSHVACRIPRLFSARFCFALFCFPHSGMSTRRCVRWAQNTVRALSEEIIACAEQRKHCVRWAQNTLRALSTQFCNSALSKNKQTKNKQRNRETNDKQTNKRQTNKQNLIAKNSLRALSKELIACTENTAPPCLLWTKNSVRAFSYELTIQYNTIQYNFIVSV